MADFNPSVFGVPTKPSGSTQEAPKFQIGAAPLVPTGGATPPKSPSTQAALFGVPGGNVSGTQGAAKNAAREPLGETGFRAAMNGAPLPSGQSLLDNLDGWFLGLQASKASA